MQNLTQIFDYLKGFLTPERLRKIEFFASQSSDFILPVLEDVYQYRNAAAIVRSVEGCGFHKVVALEERNTFDPNLTVTKGAETWVEVEKMPNSIDSLMEIKKRGYRLTAVSLEKKSIALPEYHPTKPTALLFGTEKEGVSKEALDLADETLAIPMYGFTKSFNVSVAASICMYDLKQKLMNSDINYLLSEQKQLELKIRWAVNSIPSGEQIYKQFLKTVN